MCVRVCSNDFVCARVFQYYGNICAHERACERMKAVRKIERERAAMRIVRESCCLSEKCAQEFYLFSLTVLILVSWK